MTLNFSAGLQIQVVVTDLHVYCVMQNPLPICISSGVLVCAGNDNGGADGDDDTDVEQGENVPDALVQPPSNGSRYGTDGRGGDVALGTGTELTPPPQSATPMLKRPNSLVRVKSLELLVEGGVLEDIGGKVCARACMH